MARARVSSLESHLGYWLRLVSNHVSHAFSRKVEGRGVTVAEWVVLRALFGRGGTAPSELAQRLGMTRGAVSKLVERLVGKSLVSRSAGGADRRYQSVRLTAAGEALVPELAALADQNDEEFFAVLSAGQRRTLMEAMQAIVRAHGMKEVPTS